LLPNSEDLPLSFSNSSVSFFSSRSSSSSSSSGKELSLYTLGSDESIGNCKNFANYLYSIADMYTLFIWLRQKELTYTYKDKDQKEFEYPKKGSDPYAASRENGERIFLPDPYYYGGFAESFKQSIDVILGECVGERKNENNKWTLMPELLIVAICDGSHWRSIRIKMDYENSVVRVLWDDPFGEGAFPEYMKESCSKVIKEQIGRLIKQNDSTKQLTDSNIVFSEKALKQQACGCDCGPIIFSNVMDYVQKLGATTSEFENNAEKHKHKDKNSGKYEPTGKQMYSIPDTSDKEHKDKINECRKESKAHYDSVRKDNSNVTAQIAAINAEGQIHRRGIDRFILTCKCTRGVSQDIKGLNDTEFRDLFFILQNNRYLDTAHKYSGDFTSDEINEAYNTYFNKSSGVVLLSGH
jgi:hypothetical protein